MQTAYQTRDGARTRANRQARASTAAPPILLGSLILIVGSFLEWTSGSAQVASETGVVDLNGYNIADGRIVMGIGFALLVAAALMWANKRVGSWFDADLLGVSLSTIAVVVIVTFLMDVGSTDRSAEIGIYVALAGSIIAMVGAMVALLRSGSDRATTEEDGSGDVEGDLKRRAA